MTETHYETARRPEEPSATQFSVFLANRVGQLKDLLDLLAEADVRVLGLSIVDSTDWAVIRMVVSDSDAAEGVLRANRLPFTQTEVLLVELAEAESLSQVCGHLLRAEISVHFAYPLAIRRHGNAVMVFHVDDEVLATDQLRRKGLTLLGDADVGDPG
jgi:hypothetical protein